MERLDFHGIFGVAQYVSPSGSFDLEVRRVGTLRSRGAIVACDPFGGPRPPFEQQTPTGDFEVEVLLARSATGAVVALSRVVFRVERPVRFVMATCPGQDPRALAPSQRFGYGVDSGTGCFSTCEAVRTCDGAALSAALQANREPNWSAATAPAASGVSELVAFSSGDGDGVYASWFGLDEVGAPVSLVTDFRVLDLELPPVVDDPAFRREHAERIAERLFALVPALNSMRDAATRAETYRLGTELRASPADAAHLTEDVFERYLAETGEARELLGTVVKYLLEAPEAQQRLALRFAALDPAYWVTLLKGVREELSDALLEMLWTRWDDASPELRRATLHLGTQALPSARRAPRFQAAAVEALRSNDATLVEEALGILNLLATRQLLSPLDADTRAEVQRLAVDESSAQRTRRTASKLLARLDSSAGE